MQVKLSEVIEAIDKTDVDTQYFYYIPEERIILKGDEEIKERHLIPLPTHKEIDDYSTMSMFIEEECDGEAKEWLEECIKGPGAFRRFRSTLERFNLTDKWQDYLYYAHEDLAIQWCEYYGVEYLDSNSFTMSETPVIETKSVSNKHNYRIININEDNVYGLAYLCQDFRKTLAGFKQMKFEGDVDECVEELNYYLKRNYPIFAVSDNGKYIGYCVCRIEEDVVFLESIFVRKENRHKGVGKILLDKASSIAKEYGNDTLYISVHPNNDEMLRFLRNNGYDVLNLIEVRKAYHDEQNNETYTIGNNTYKY